MRILPIVFLALLSQWAIAQEATLHIHDVIGDDESEVFFGGVGLIVPDEEGNLYVTDTRRRDILHISPAGQLIRTIGSRGDGPGEFRDLTNMVLVGDSLVVHDMHLMRLTVFDLEGQLINTCRLSDDTITAEKLIAVLGPSRLLMYRPPDTLNEMPGAFRVTDMNGEIVHTVDIDASALFDVSDELSSYSVTSTRTVVHSSWSPTTILLSNLHYSGRTAAIHFSMDRIGSRIDASIEPRVEKTDVYDAVDYSRGDPVENMPSNAGFYSRQRGVFAFISKRYNTGHVHLPGDRWGVVYKERCTVEAWCMLVDAWDDKGFLGTFPILLEGKDVSLDSFNIRFAGRDGVLFISTSTPTGEPVLAIGRLELP